MTTRAREVLSDCEHALADFSASASTPYQRPRWVALITLLRTVLDVLDKIDLPAGEPQLKSNIRAARKRLFARKPEPRIFHEFIEDERNDSVHEFNVSATVNITVKLGHGTTTYDFVMRDGPFKGQDPRRLGREAIAFWRGYLDEIDAVRAEVSQ